MAAAGVAILDNPNLGGDALAHCVGMTDDPHLLALRTLQHGEGVDDGGEGIRVEGSEAFIDEQILNGEEPDAAEQRLTAAKDEATKAADNQNENITKPKNEQTISNNLFMKNKI